MSYEKNGNEVVGFVKLTSRLRSPVVLLTLIGIAGLTIRLYYFPYNIPLTLDALLYFWFATDVSTLGYIPPSYSFPNNFWPIIVSGVFSIIKFTAWTDYMDLQRMLTVAISLITIIPLYFLLKKFVEYQYALIGVTLFILDPRVIQNSLSGLTDPLFVFLGTITLALFLNKKKWLVYASFATLGLFSLTRYEGLLLFIPLTIMFLVRFRRDKVLVKYAIAFTIFILVLTPLAYIRVQTTGNDGLISHVIAGTEVATEDIVPDSTTNKFSIVKGLEIFVRLGAWSSFPTYFLFVIPGIYLLFRNGNYEKHLIILASAAFLLPALYASSRSIEETRYFLMISIVFNIAAVLTISKIIERFGHKKSIFFVVILFAITASAIFLYWKTDNQHERDSVRIAEEVIKRTAVINDYHPESIYLRTVGFNEHQDFAGKKAEIQDRVVTLFTSEYLTLEEFLAYGKSQGLQYLIVDNQENRPTFLIDVFNNESKYPYLTKDFDSANAGLDYHVKIFKINYNLMGLEAN